MAGLVKLGHDPVLKGIRRQMHEEVRATAKRLGVKGALPGQLIKRADDLLTDNLDTTFPPGQSWEQELWRCRTRRNIGSKELAVKIRGANWRDVESWEKGASYPNNEQLNFLEIRFPSLRKFHHQLLAKRKDWEEAKKAPKNPAPPPEPPKAEAAPEPETRKRAGASKRTPEQIAEQVAFGKKFKAWRTTAGLSQKKVADMLGLVRGAPIICNWEKGINGPIQELREKLVQLWPAIEPHLPTYVSGNKVRPTTPRQLEELQAKATEPATLPLLEAVPEPPPTPEPPRPVVVVVADPSPFEDPLDFLSKQQLACLRTLQSAIREQNRIREEQAKVLAQLEEQERAAALVVTDAERAYNEAKAALDRAVKS